MGREIRLVAPNNQHPMRECSHYGRCTPAIMFNGKCFIPKFEEDYVQAVTEWVRNHDLWLKGEHPDQARSPEFTRECKFYAQWNGDCPDVESYDASGVAKEQRTWFQVYETVTEGTPISPPFATKEELVNWLATNRDYWDYGWTREQAESFVMGSGWAPSLVVANGAVMTGVEALAVKEAE